MYDIIPKCKERNFHLCVHNGNCAVGTETLDRELFERIFQRAKIDYYICPECQYLYIGSNYDIIADSLQMIKKDTKGLYITFPTQERIYLNSSNFFIICKNKDCSRATVWVKKYVPKQKEEGSF